jgi:hypothetical protein
LLLGGVRPNEEQKHGQDFKRRRAPARFLEDNFLEDKKVRAALGVGRPRAYRSGDGVGGDVTGRVAPKLVF